MNNETIEQLTARAYQVLQALTPYPLWVRVSFHSGCRKDGVEPTSYLLGVSSDSLSGPIEYQSFCGADFDEQLESASEYLVNSAVAKAAKLKKIEQQVQALGYKLVKEEAA